MLYRIHMACSNSDGRNMGFLIAPRAGHWSGAVFAESGILSGGDFVIPSDGGTVSRKAEASVEGKYNPRASSPIWLQFMPTAGSSFPVRAVAVPY